MAKRNGDSDAKIKDLKKDPRNARFHPARNMAMLEDSMREVGAGRSIVIDEDNVILAGNGATEAAQRVGIDKVRIIDADGDELIAVRRKGLTPEQKIKLALWDNRAQETSEWDPDVLRSMEAEFGESLKLKGLGGLFTDSEMEKLVKETKKLDIDKTLQDTPAFDKQAFNPAYVLNVGAVFSSSNEWEIPDFLPDKFSTKIPVTSYYGEKPIEHPEQKYFMFNKTMPIEAKEGLIAFYQNDDSFESIWFEPGIWLDDFAQKGVTDLVMPDFSTYFSMPLPIRLYNYHRSRHIARLWQEAGFNVMPSLSGTGVPEMQKFTLYTLPKEMPVVSCQCRTLGTEKTGRTRNQALFIKGLIDLTDYAKIGTVLIYGGGDHAAWLKANLPTGPGRPEFKLIPSRQELRRRKIEVKKKVPKGKIVVDIPDELDDNVEEDAETD